jgi:hypothetical protein
MERVLERNAPGFVGSDREHPRAHSHIFGARSKGSSLDAAVQSELRSFGV